MDARMFVVLTFGVSWSLYAAAAMVPLTAAGSLSGLAVALLYGGTFGPAAVGMLLASRSPTGVAGLLNGVRKIHVPLWYYAFAIGYMLSIKTIAALTHRVLTGESLHAGFAWYLFPVAVAISAPVQIGEELGWRGYLLPRVASQIGYRRAGLFIGAIWAAWHLPLFFIRGVDLYGQSF